MKSLRKVVMILLVAVVMIGAFAACDIAHEHSFGEWVVTKEATCTAAGVKTKTCECGETETEEFAMVAHTWVDATCTAPKTCSVCKATEGEALGHILVEATCTAPKICSVCKATEGDVLGHTWSDATCTAPKTCSACQATEGEALGHTWADATCTAPKKCLNCNATIGGVSNHVWTDATCSAPKTCTVCKITDGKTDPAAHSGTNECILCKTNYRQVLIDYLQMYGEHKYSVHTKQNYWSLSETIYTKDITLKLSFEYTPDTDKLLCTIREAYNSDSFFFTVQITKSSEQYDYSYSDVLNYPATQDRVSGYIIPKDITLSTNTLPFNSVTCGDGYHSQDLLAKRCATYLKHLLYGFNEFCEDRSLNISAKDFGFINY